MTFLFSMRTGFLSQSLVGFYRTTVFSFKISLISQFLVSIRRWQFSKKLCWLKNWSCDITFYFSWYKQKCFLVSENCDTLFCYLLGSNSINVNRFWVHAIFNTWFSERVYLPLPQRTTPTTSLLPTSRLTYIKNEKYVFPKQMWQW